MVPLGPTTGPPGAQMPAWAWWARRRTGWGRPGGGDGEHGAAVGAAVAEVAAEGDVDPSVGQSQGGALLVVGGWHREQAGCGAGRSGRC